MIVILHVVIALASIGLTSWAYVRPSSQKLHASYAAIGLTLASGLYLVWATPSHMLQTCISGVVYLGVVSIGIAAVRSKLARRAGIISTK